MLLVAMIVSFASSSTDFLEMNLSNESLAAETAREEPVSRNFSVDSLQGTDAVPSSIIEEARASWISSLPNFPSHASSPEYKGLNKSTNIRSSRDSATSTVKERPSLAHSQLSTEVNSSAIRRASKLRKFKGAPSVVVPISEMNDLLSQSHVSYHSMVCVDSTRMYDVYWLIAASYLCFLPL